MIRALRRIWNDEAGATLVEYALLVALIAVVAVAAVALFGRQAAEIHRTNAETIGDASELACEQGGGTPQLDGDGNYQGCSW